MLPVLFLILQTLFALYLVYYIVAFISGAPFVPTADNTARSMILQAHLRPGMTVYDLGSGDGRLLSLSAQKGAKAVGIEINPILVVYTWLRFLFSPYRKCVSVRWQSFWKSNMNDADVVFIYLLPIRMEKLEKLLSKKLKPGTIVVSNSFIFPHWKALRQDPANHVYVFRV
jgi:hypothetical protein